MSSETLKRLRIEAVLSPGQTVSGRYRVEQLLAEGGMAAVWSGENLRTGKRVALKVIKRSFATQDGAEEMFRLESIAASKVNHPNVVSIFDVIDHDGMTCIVMELLHGETFAAYLDSHKPLSLSETVMLLLPAMRGVAAAHARGVVHRDIKPGNIFLCRDSDGILLTTKVLDFGISQMGDRLPKTESDQIDLTRFGTPAYMSPEDLSGTSAVDARTDVYAFGVLLFEALTGRVPFDGPPSLELVEKILSQPAKKIRSLRPELSVDVEEIIDSALAKNPDERFSDVAHMVAAIEERLLVPQGVPLASMGGTQSSSRLPPGASTRLLADLRSQAQPAQGFQSEERTSLSSSRTRLFSRVGTYLRSWRGAVAAGVVLAVSFIAVGLFGQSPETRLPQMGAPAATGYSVPAPPPIITPTPPTPVPAAPRPVPALVMPPTMPAAASSPADPFANESPFEELTTPVKRVRSGSARKTSNGPAPRAGRLSVSDF